MISDIHTAPASTSANLRSMDKHSKLSWCLSRLTHLTCCYIPAWMRGQTTQLLAGGTRTTTERYWFKRIQLHWFKCNHHAKSGQTTLRKTLKILNFQKLIRNKQLPSCFYIFFYTFTVGCGVHPPGGCRSGPGPTRPGAARIEPHNGPWHGPSLESLHWNHSMDFYPRFLMEQRGLLAILALWTIG